MRAEEIAEKLEKTGLPLKVEKVANKRVFVLVKPDSLVSLAELMREDLSARLVAISPVDRGLELEVIYHFDVGGVLVNVRTNIPKRVNRLPSLTGVYKGADWMEREVHDLMGIRFEGHPNLKRLVLPYEWPEGKHPLRKPLVGEVPSPQDEYVKQLYEKGVLVPYPAVTMRWREKAGLPKTPPVAFTDVKQMEEVKGLLKTVKFDKRVGVG